MAPTGIHHLGIAVADLDEAVATYERLFGAEVERRWTVEERGIEAVLLKVGSDRVELLTSRDAETPVGKFIAKHGPGMHHIAYEVEDVRAELEQLAQRGAELIDEEPRIGVLGNEIAFVHPSAVHGVLSELVGRG